MTTQAAIPRDTATLAAHGDRQVLRTTARPRSSVDAAVVAPRSDRPVGRATDRDLAQLRRFQWAVRAALALGVAASVCANVLHARHNLIAQTIAAWPPLVLMLTVELISRVPVYRRVLAALRILATAGIASIAAYVSYFHMAAVASKYGEHQPNPYLLPISVDGLIVVASVSLVELAGHIRSARDISAVTHGANPPTRHEPPHPGSEAVTAEGLARHMRGDGQGHVVPPATAPPLPTTAPPTVEAPLPAMVSAPPSPLAPTTPHVQAPATDRGDGPAGDRDDDTNPELAALLPAARAARDALRRDGRSLTRDSLAAQLRRDGHTIRTSRVSTLVNLLRTEASASGNGKRGSSPN
jgi:Protein of unknown function (DUF2637)